jgi:hypothetical protein
MIRVSVTGGCADAGLGPEDTGSSTAPMVRFSAVNCPSAPKALVRIDEQPFPVERDDNLSTRPNGPSA